MESGGATNGTTDKVVGDWWDDMWKKVGLLVERGCVTIEEWCCD